MKNNGKRILVMVAAIIMMISPAFAGEEGTDESKFNVLSEVKVNFGDDFETAKSEAAVNDSITGSGWLKIGDKISGKLNVYTYSDGNERQVYNKATHEAAVYGLGAGDVVKIDLADEVSAIIDRSDQYSSGLIRDNLSINLKAEKLEHTATPNITADLVRYVGLSNWKGDWHSEDGNGMGSYSGGSLERSVLGNTLADASLISIRDEYGMNASAMSQARDSTVSVATDVTGVTNLNFENSVDYFDRQVMEVSSRAYQAGKNGAFETRFSLERSGER